MRSKLQHKFISTPTVYNTAKFPRDWNLTLVNDDWSTNEAKLIILERIGSGSEGEVFNAKLIYTNSENVQCEYPCVVKKLFAKNHDPNTPLEFILQKKLTHNHPSAESGLLRMMGINDVTDERGKTHKYALMPKCDVILSNLLPDLFFLQQNPENKLISQHITMNVVQSLILGLENLLKNKIVHRDLKPENIGLHNDVWCMLDFGLAQHYDDFFKQKHCERRRGSIEGTQYYIPPERLNNEYGHPFARDVWAIGQIFLQLAGKRCSFEVNEDGMHLETTPHIFAKGNAYRLKRKSEVGVNLFDFSQHQLRLQNDIAQKTTFENCFDYLTDAMCDIFPERRPNLETLQKACEKLKLLLPKLSLKQEQELKRFYDNSAQKTKPVNHQTQLPYYSHHTHFFSRNQRISGKKTTLPISPLHKR